MTTISSIRDYISSAIASQLTGSVELPDPYDLTQNPSLYLRHGYGVAIGPDANPETDLSKMWYEQVFSVPLTIESYSVENATARVIDSQKELLENRHKVRKILESNQGMGGLSSKVSYLASSGIQLLVSGDLRFLTITLDFAVLYSEDYL